MQKYDHLLLIEKNLINYIYFLIIITFILLYFKLLINIIKWNIKLERISWCYLILTFFQLSQ